MVKTLLPITWCLVITILSGMSSDKMPKIDFFQADKIGHFTFYAIFSLLIMNALNGEKRWLRNASIAFAIASVYGVLMEYAQYYVFAGRQFDWADALANTIGSLLGIYVFGKIKNHPWMNKKL